MCLDLIKISFTVNEKIMGTLVYSKSYILKVQTFFYYSKYVVSMYHGRLTRFYRYGFSLGLYKKPSFYILTEEIRPLLLIFNRV